MSLVETESSFSRVGSSFLAVGELQKAEDSINNRLNLKLILLRILFFFKSSIFKCLISHPALLLDKFLRGSSHAKKKE